MVSRRKILAVFLAVSVVTLSGGCGVKSTSIGSDRAAAQPAAAETAEQDNTAAERAAAKTSAAETSETEMSDTQFSAQETAAGPEPLMMAAEGKEKTGGPGADEETPSKDSDSRSDIEAFAELVQEAVADKDMEAMAKLAAFPLTIETTDKEKIILKDREEFLKQNPDLIFGDDLMTVIANVDTATLQMGADGVKMGDGVPSIHFAMTAEGRLCITDVQE